MSAIFKKIKRAIVPKWVKQIRGVQEKMHSSFMEALFKAHVYGYDESLPPVDNFVRQFEGLMRHLSFDIVDNYVYVYNPWSKRIMQPDAMGLVSMTVDYKSILESSLSELRNKLHSCKDESFKKNELRIVEAIQDAGERTRGYLKNDKTKRGQELSKCFASLLNGEPHTLDEALQKILFYNGLFWQVGHKHNGLGRLDLILGKYYNDDINAGIITKEQAKSMLLSFVKIVGKDTIHKSSMLKGDTGQYILLGGVDKDGNTVQNDITLLLLEIFTELKRPDPKLILRVNKDTSSEVWMKAVDCVLTGCGSPLIMNEELVMERMIQFGYKKNDVWNVGTSACWEPLIIGKSFDQNNPFPNIIVLKSLDEVLKGNRKFMNIDTIKAEVKLSLAKQIKHIIHDLTFDVSPLYTLFFDSCIENEKDYTRGGADYAYHGVQVVSLPNFINALLNIEKYVFEQKLVTLDDCIKAICANYEGYEDVQLLFKSNDLMFGSANPHVIQLTNEFMDFIGEEVGKYTCNGEKLKVGFSSAQYILACNEVPASLDGRKAYKPFAVHISPLSQTIDIQEVLQFASSLRYSGNRLNGNVVDIIIPPAYIKNKEKLCTIIKSAITNGVYEIQMNVLDAKTLKDAKLHPEKYPNLVVRVWGFSAYFNDLPEEYKDNLITRAEANYAI